MPAVSSYPSVTPSAADFVLGALAAGTVKRYPISALLSQTVIDASGTVAITAANAALYNNSILFCTNAGAQNVTIAAGTNLTQGITIVQANGAGIVTLGGTSIYQAPNGQTTDGSLTVLSVTPTGVLDTYMVLASQTADRTQLFGNSGSTPVLDLSKYNVIDITLNAATVTPSFVGMVSGQTFAVTLLLRQDGTGGRTWSGPTTKWGNGTPPTYVTTASAINIITMMTLDGGITWFGFIGGVGFA